METFLQFNWISLFALSIILLLFVLIYYLSKRINWTLVILISLALGIGVGFIFKSDDNSYLMWVSLIGKIFIKVITALIAPVILISIISSLISLKGKNNIKQIGFKSVFWLMLSAFSAIILSLIVGTSLNLGKGAGAVFEGINNVSSGTIDAYSGLTKSFDEVLLNLFPSNIVNDIGSNNVVAIIIISIALALGYISVSKSNGEESVASFKNLVNSTKRIIYRILAFVIKLTPYAVLSLIASSASKIFTNSESIIQLLILVGLIYGVSLFHTYIINGAFIYFTTKVNPFKFFKKMLPSNITAFTTQSSVGTLPVTIKNLVDAGVSEDVANFTAPLGTTIGMPGCTAIWPTLLVIFFVNATNLGWGAGDYIVFAFLSLILSLGSAGVPGIAIVTAISLFDVLGLPVAAVILLMPINTISDMMRTLDNVSTAGSASFIVAKQVNEFDIDVFNGKKEAISSSENTFKEVVIKEEKKAEKDSLLPVEEACSFTPKKKEKK